ncbi:MAG: respiratory nitrate reductase subunit gamma [Ignavibacteriae bacterium]|nr:respiratory nitrate reductase subunit gamma [Ignavibacteriota bacterium]
MYLLFIFTYLSVLIFLAVVIYKFVKIASSPVHLRWELYPVPHEKGRASYGGSILEEVDWWTKKREKDHLGELKVMVPEILLLKGVWEHNKELWLGSFPFHFALYLFIGNIALLIVGTLFQITGISPFVFGASSNWATFWSIFRIVIDAIIWIASILGILGAIRLLFTRIVNRKLVLYSTASHYFNIILIGTIYLTALLWRIADSGMVTNLMGYYLGLITFSKEIAINLPVQIPKIGYAHVIISLIFIIYLPFTHMTHFFAKYFTYHSVRWEDTPNAPGSKIAERVGEQLNQKVTWAAPHIGADGNRNWIAIASAAPSKEVKK